MGRRLAYLIGNQIFRSDSGFHSLQGPSNDVNALARLLKDPERGQFEVHEFLDKGSYEILPIIDEALNNANVEDLILIYYSGHGTRDRSGRLCLITANTTKSSLLTTSISARQLSEVIDQSDCNQIILILDCCYSGAFDNVFRGSVGDELQIVENASGFYIITASTAFEVARETTKLEDGLIMGRLTAKIVDGIEKGQADHNNNGKIFLSDIRKHLSRTVVGQTPQFFDRRAAGDPLISLSPSTAKSIIDAELLEDFEDKNWQRRKGAAAVILNYTKEKNLTVKIAVKNVLQSQLAKERDFDVRLYLEQCLNLLDIDIDSAKTTPQSQTDQVKSNNLKNNFGPDNSIHDDAKTKYEDSKNRNLVKDLFDLLMFPVFIFAPMIIGSYYYNYVVINRKAGTTNSPENYIIEILYIFIVILLPLSIFFIPFIRKYYSNYFIKFLILLNTSVALIVTILSLNR